ncbi:MAG: universal stress protein [Elainella sp.]
MFHKLLVALDDSNMRQAVFDEALNLAKALDAHLLLLHVLVPEDLQTLLPAVYPYSPSLSDSTIELYQRQRTEVQERGLNLLKLLESQATDAGVIIEFTQNLGSPGRVICEQARNYGADAIVIGRRGHSGLSELVLGSVSNYVLHHAPCSVLVIQGQTTTPSLATTNEVATPV